MRTLLTALATAAAAAALAVPAEAVTKTVKVGDNYFVRSGTRPLVVVKKNDIVKWVWRGRVAHNVFAVSGPRKFNSWTFVKGSYQRRMKVRGLYKIVCTLHSGMEMKLRVR